MQQNIQLKVFSELYGETDDVICNINETIRLGHCPCGDGSDYFLTQHELNQLKAGYDENSFIPSSKLAYPLNLVALMRIKDNQLLLPVNFRFNKKQYADVKSVLIKAGGKYSNNSFILKEQAQLIYNRIINGEDYNLKKKFQYFATPDKLADKIIELADCNNKHVILEPSAGQGSLILALQRKWGKGRMVHAFEMMPENQTELKKISRVDFLGDDFLAYSGMHKFDRIIANPPFSKNQDIDHIRKMWECLKTGGRIVTMASTHWINSDNEKEKEFKAWISKIKADIIPVEAGAFKQSGTSIATVIIVINK